MHHRNVCRARASALKTGAALVLAGLVAGCSGDVLRFSDSFYTNAVPARPAAPVQTPYPGAPGGVDPMMTASTPARTAFPEPSRPASAPQTINRAAAQAAVAAPVARQPVAPAVATNTMRPAVPSVPVSANQASVPTATPQPAFRPPSAPLQTAQNNVPQGVDPMTTASVATAETPRAVTSGSGEGWTRAGGTYVRVQPGETVYNMAKRYGVPANAIMEANGIKHHTEIGPGQRIIIPTYVYSRSAPVSAPDADSNVRSASADRGGRSEFELSKAPRPQTRPAGEEQAMVTNTVPVAAPRQPLPQAQPSPVEGGYYTVTGGDSLYAISKKTGASVNGIRLANNLSSDVLRVGQRLLIPGQSSDRIAQTAINANPTIDPMTTSSVPSARAQDNQRQTTTGTEVASIDRSSDALAPSATGVTGMRWPANGRIITAFQENEDGAPNEGIDISLPMGTPIKAAENGVVIYSGDGLKELGRTVLLRHGDGMVTVYGHAEDIKVQRGDVVQRGQVIASSGMSGNARQPKLHFEVRKNTTAVDPRRYLN